MLTERFLEWLRKRGGSKFEEVGVVGVVGDVISGDETDLW